MPTTDLDPGAAALGRKCVKCESPGILSGIDAKKAVYCRPCFVQMVKHKFRSALGKRRVYKDGASKETLLVFDGSPAAALALGQLVESKRETDHRKLMIEPTVLLTLETTDPERAGRILQRYAEIGAKLAEPGIGIPFRIAHIAAGLQKNIELRVDSGEQYIGKEQIAIYERLLSAMQSTTARSEMTRLFGELLAARFAAATGIDKIWLPRTGDDLSKDVVSFFSLGKGAHTSSLISVSERRLGVNFLRPMHDIGDKEVALLNRLEGYDERYETPDCREPLPPASIHLVAANFIDMLQREGYTATTSTLLASTAKIVDGSAKAQEYCRICGSPATQKEKNSAALLCYPCRRLREECSEKTLFDQALCS
ncbi:unnamed protein product, partial [Mesorhabditis spiculigera]